jgi:hypothetical protein
MNRNTRIQHEWEARRLRAEHAHDPLASIAIALDLHVRRLAYRLARAFRNN